MGPPYHGSTNGTSHKVELNIVAKVGTDAGRNSSLTDHIQHPNINQGNALALTFLRWEV